MKRKSKWTEIYWATDIDGKFVPYIRFVPGFCDLEKIGYPHGIVLSSGFITEKEDAIVLADKYDKFFDAIFNEFIEGNAMENKYDFPNCQENIGNNSEDEIIVATTEFEPSKYYTIGEYFTINNELYKTVNTDYDSCLGCDFIKKEHCGWDHQHE